MAGTVKITAEPQEIFAGEEIRLTVIITKPSEWNPPLPEDNNPQYKSDIKATSNKLLKNNERLPREIDLVFVAAGGYELFCRITRCQDEISFSEYKGVRPTKGIPAGIYKQPQLYETDTGEDWGEVSYKGNTVLIIKESQFQSVISKSNAPQPTDDQGLWAAIRNRTQAIGFDSYAEFIDKVFCRYSKGEDGDKNIFYDKIKKIKEEPYINAADSYPVLRLATQFFLFIESGLVNNNWSEEVFKQDQERHRLEDSSATLTTVSAKLERYLGGSQGELPYLKRILKVFLGPEERTRETKLAYCNEILKHRFSRPSMLELIWSYWHEEAMLVQSMNAIALRFQNRRGAGKRDPLAHLEIDPLHGLNNLL
ncbi:MAG: hypothetical protein D3909_10690, partial [Candidatus Electrothrix sp. ATG1]|nr:hypothetical protein [Candidatus Electrothrix sp. ATG1]